ncbi:hypothetical protein SLA2020_525040 [Shorea laevis]
MSLHGPNYYHSVLSSPPELTTESTKQAQEDQHPSKRDAVVSCHHSTEIHFPAKFRPSTSSGHRRKKAQVAVDEGLQWRLSLISETTMENGKTQPT